MGLEGGGDQQVFSGRQREALGHLPHVDVGLAASLGRVVAEEVFVCVVFAARSLNGQEEKRWIRIDALGSALSISMKQQEGRTFVFLSDWTQKPLTFYELCFFLFRHRQTNTDIKSMQKLKAA